MIGIGVPAALFLCAFLIIAVLLLEYTDGTDHHHHGRS